MSEMVEETFTFAESDRKIGPAFLNGYADFVRLESYQKLAAEVAKLNAEIERLQKDLDDANRAWGSMTKNAEDAIIRLNQVRAELARVKRESVSLQDLRETVNAMCSCGGAGPYDPNCCDVCMLWHRLSRTTKPQEGKG